MVDLDMVDITIIILLEIEEGLISLIIVCQAVIDAMIGTNVERWIGGQGLDMNLIELYLQIKVRRRMFWHGIFIYFVV